MRFYRTRLATLWSRMNTISVQSRVLLLYLKSVFEFLIKKSHVQQVDSVGSEESQAIEVESGVMGLTLFVLDSITLVPILQVQPHRVALLH